MNNTFESRFRPPGGTIRQLRPSDLPRFRDHLLRLDVDSRRDRFNGPSSDRYLSSYAERSFQDGTIVVGFLLDGEVLGTAELHELPDATEPTGEIAFSVERALQHRGIGGLLFERVIGHARALGYTRLFVTTHPNNLAMKRLAKKFGARLTFADCETNGRIDLEPLPELAAHGRRSARLAGQGAGCAFRLMRGRGTPLR